MQTCLQHLATGARKLAEIAEKMAAPMEIAFDGAALGLDANSWLCDLPLRFELDEDRGRVVAAQHLYKLLGYGGNEAPLYLVAQKNLLKYVRNAGVEPLQCEVAFPHDAEAMRQVVLTPPQTLKCIMNAKAGKKPKEYFTALILDNFEALVATEINNGTMLDYLKSKLDDNRARKPALIDGIVDAILQHGDAALAARAVVRLLRGSTTEGRNVGGELERVSFDQLVQPELLPRGMGMPPRAISSRANKERMNRLAGLMRAVSFLAAPAESTVATGQLSKSICVLLDKFLLWQRAYMNQLVQHGSPNFVRMVRQMVYNLQRPALRVVMPQVSAACVNVLFRQRDLRSVVPTLMEPLVTALGLNATYVPRNERRLFSTEEVVRDQLKSQLKSLHARDPVYDPSTDTASVSVNLAKQLEDFAAYAHTCPTNVTYTTSIALVAPMSIDSRFGMYHRWPRWSLLKTRHCSKRSMHVVDVSIGGDAAGLTKKGFPYTVFSVSFASSPYLRTTRIDCHIVLIGNFSDSDYEELVFHTADLKEDIKYVTSDEFSLPHPHIKGARVGVCVWIYGDGAFWNCVNGAVKNAAQTNYPLSTTTASIDQITRVKMYLPADVTLEVQRMVVELRSMTSANYYSKNAAIFRGIAHENLFGLENSLGLRCSLHCDQTNMSRMYSKSNGNFHAHEGSLEPLGEAFRSEGFKGEACDTKTGQVWIIKSFGGSRRLRDENINLWVKPDADDGWGGPRHKHNFLLASIGMVFYAHAQAPKILRMNNPTAFKQVAPRCYARFAQGRRVAVDAWVKATTGYDGSMATLVAAHVMQAVEMETTINAMADGSALEMIHGKVKPNFKFFGGGRASQSAVVRAQPFQRALVNYATESAMREHNHVTSGAASVINTLIKEGSAVVHDAPPCGAIERVLEWTEEAKTLLTNTAAKLKLNKLGGWLASRVVEAKAELRRLAAEARERRHQNLTMADGDEEPPVEEPAPPMVDGSMWAALLEAQGDEAGEEADALIEEYEDFDDAYDEPFDDGEEQGVPAGTVGNAVDGDEAPGAADELAEDELEPAGDDARNDAPEELQQAGEDAGAGADAPEEPEGELEVGGNAFPLSQITFEGADSSDQHEGNELTKLKFSVSLDKIVELTLLIQYYKLPPPPPPPAGGDAERSGAPAAVDAEPMAVDPDPVEIPERALRIKIRETLMGDIHFVSGGMSIDLVAPISFVQTKCGQNGGFKKPPDLATGGRAYVAVMNATRMVIRATDALAQLAEVVTHMRNASPLLEYLMPARDGDEIAMADLPLPSGHDKERATANLAMLELLEFASLGQGGAEALAHRLSKILASFFGMKFDFDKWMLAPVEAGDTVEPWLGSKENPCTCTSCNRCVYVELDDTSPDFGYWCLFESDISPIAKECFMTFKRPDGVVVSRLIEDAKLNVGRRHVHCMPSNILQLEYLLEVKRKDKEKREAREAAKAAKAAKAAERKAKRAAHEEVQRQGGATDGETVGGDDAADEAADDEATTGEGEATDWSWTSWGEKLKLKYVKVVFGDKPYIGRIAGGDEINGAQIKYSDGDGEHVSVKDVVNGTVPDGNRTIRILHGPPFVCDVCGDERAHVEKEYDENLGCMKAHKHKGRECSGAGKVPFQGTRIQWQQRRAM